MAGETRILKFAEGVATGAPVQTFLQANSFGQYASEAAFVASKGSPAAEGDTFFNTTIDKLEFYDGTSWRIVESLKNNFVAVADPAVGNDNTQGYQVGSKWLNTATNGLFFAVDVTTGAADWQQVGAPLVGKREIPSGSVNGINTAYVISFTPIDETIQVLRNGTVVPESQYSFVHPTITFTIAPAIGSIIEAQYLTNGTPAITPVSGGTLYVYYHDVTGGEITAKQLTLPNTPAVPSSVILDIVGGTPQRYSVDFTVSGAVVNWNTLRLESQIISGSELRFQYFI